MQHSEDTWEDTSRDGGAPISAIYPPNSLTHGTAATELCKFAGVLHTLFSEKKHIGILLEPLLVF